MTNNIQGNSHHSISWFFNRHSTSQKGMAWYISSDEREEQTTKNTLPSKTLLQIWRRNQKLSRQTKVKIIQHHQTNFITNVKGTSLGRKHKRRKRPTENKHKTTKKMVTRSSVQSLSRVWLFVTPWITAHQASLSITNSWSSLKLMSIESVMPSSHLILCCPLLLLPPIPPSISLFQWVNSSNQVAKVLEFQL